MDTDSRIPGSKPVKFITHCPECGEPLTRFEDEAAHYCTNEDSCPPQIKGKIEHFISRKAMNIEGLGPETVDLFYQEGMINNAADLYELKEQEIAKLERFGEKSAQNIMAGLEASKQVGFERVIFALGIRFVGETVAKKLAKSVKNIDTLISASKEELIAIDEIGEKIAESIIHFFSSEKNRILVERLKAAGLKMEVDAEEVSMASNILEGQSVVISGVFAVHSRDEYKDIIEKHGGKNVGSISKKTSFILAGENMGPSKLEKAKSLGIKIMSEEEFLNMISSHTENTQTPAQEEVEDSVEKKEVETSEQIEKPKADENENKKKTATNIQLELF